MSTFHALNIDEEEHTGQAPLLHVKHAKFFIRFLNLLPARLASHDSTRGTIAFFAVAGLDLLKSLHMLTPQMREDIVEWIYGSLIEPHANEPCCGGFQGSRSVILKSVEEDLLVNARRYQWGHLALTYTSIGVLITLGDDLSRLDRKSIVDGVAAVQQPDGSFSACINGSENDMRFVYCAAAICNMLDYWGDVDKERMFQFIQRCMRYDNGFSQQYECESHGGTTFCALAALKLSGQLERLDTRTIEGIKRWLIMRQIDGFQGRPNKPVDTCYSFWIGAALQILGAYEFVDSAANRKYIMETQDNVVGGFAKWPQSTTDPFHTYFGLSGLSFMREPGLSDVMPSLNISMPAYRRLQQLQTKWRTENSDDRFTKSAAEVSVGVAAAAAGTSGTTPAATMPTNGTDECDSVTSPLIAAQ